MNLSSSPTSKKIGIYCRVSTDTQEERGTIESQVEYATKYCDLNGIDIAAWYKDDGITGTLPLEERQGGSQVLADAKSGIIDTLLVYKLDRFGRNARIILNGIYALENLGVKVKSMTEPFDTSDPAGRFTLTILAGVADLERENILARLSAGANRAARAGKWLGGIVPYGYYVNADGFLSINDDNIPGMDMSEADVIRLIYTLTVEQKMSTMKIADYLNSAGIPPRYVIDDINARKSGGKRRKTTAGIWNPARIGSMIKETTYRGLHVYGRRTKKEREKIEREVPAIVVEGTWYAAQNVLKENRIESKRNAKADYLLRSLVKCGSCGAGYSGSYTHDKKRYICNNRLLSHKRKLVGCKNQSVDGDVLEASVWAECVDFIRNPGKLFYVSENEDSNQSEKADHIKHEIAFVEKSLESKLLEKHSILDAFRKHIINDRDLEIQMLRIGQEEKMLETQRSELKNAIITMRQMDAKKSEAEEMLLSYQQDIEDENLSWERKREIVKEIIQQVTVVQDDSDPSRDKPRIYYDVTFIFKKLPPSVDTSIVANCTDKDSSRR